MQEKQTQDQIIAALRRENARLLEAERLYRQEAETLRQATTALITAVDLRQVLDGILLHLEGVVPYDSACIFLLNGSGQRVVAGRGFADLSQVVGREYATDNNLSRELQSTQRPIYITDVQADERFEGWGGTDYVRGWMVVPLVVRDQLIGCLTLDSRQVGTYGPTQATLAQAFANQAAVAIENARLFETERRQRARAETLQKVGSLIASSLDLDEVLNNIAQQVLALLDAPACNIMLLESPDTLAWRVSIGVPDEWSLLNRRRLGQGLSGWVAARRQPLAVYEMAEDQRASNPTLVRKHNFRSFLGVPMEIKGGLVGVLNIYTRTPRHFSDEEVELMVAFAGQAAIAVENARLFAQVQAQTITLEAKVMARTTELISANEQLREEVAERQRMQEALQTYATNLERRAVQLQVAAEVARDATVARNLDDLLKRAVSLVCERFGFYYAGIFLVDDAGEYVVLQAATGEAGRQMLDRGHKLKVGEAGIVGHVAGRGQPRVALDVVADAVHLKNPLLPETRSEMALPLRVGEWVIGVLDVQSDEPAAFDDDDVAVLQLMADQLAVAIESMRLLAKTRQRVQELAGLHEIAQAFGNLTDVREAYSTLAERMGHLVDAPMCVVALFNPATGEIEAQAPGYGVSDEIVVAARYQARDLQDVWHFRKHGTFMANSRAEIPRYFDRFLDQFGLEAILVSPMLVEGRLVGVVVVANKPGGFSQDDARLLGVFASQAGVVIENARLFAATRRQLEELSALHAVTAAGATAASEETLIERATELIGETLCPNNFGILLLDEAAGMLRVTPPYYASAPLALQEVPLGHGVTGRVAAEGRPLRVADVTQVEAYIAGDSQTRSELCVPLKIGERVIGVINLENWRPNAFSEADERFLATMSGQLATAIEKLRLLEAERRRSQQLALLNETAREMAGAIHLSHLCQVVAERLQSALRYYNVEIYTVDQGTARVVMQAIAGAGTHLEGSQPGLYWQALGQGLIGRVAVTGERLLVNDINQNPDFYEASGLAICSELVLPLRSGQQIIGVLNVDSDRPNAFDDGDVAILTIVADRLAVALERVRLFEATQRQVEELTVLHSVAIAVAEATHVDSLIERVTEIIGKTLYPDIFGVLLVDWTAGIIYAHPSYRKRTGPLPVTSVPIGVGITGSVAADGLPRRVLDVSQEPAYFAVDPQTRCELCVPIKIGEQVFGVVNAESFRPAAFSAADQRLLTTIAGQLATAIEKLQLFETERQRATRQRNLAETAGAMLAALDMDMLWPAITTTARQTLEADRVAVYAYEAARDRLSCPFAEGLSAEYVAEINRRFHDAPGSRLLQNSQPIVINDVEANPATAPLRELMLREGIQAYTVFPLTGPEAPLGALVVYRNSPRPFTAEDLTTGQTLAHIVAVALQNSRLFEELTETLVREQRLNEVARAISGALDLPTILPAIVRLAVELVGADAGALSLIEPDGETTSHPYIFNLPEALKERRESRGDSVAWSIIESGESLLLADYANHPRAAPAWIKVGVREFIGVPVIAGEMSLGALGLFSLSGDRCFSQRDLALAESVGRQAGVAIQNARLYAEARQRAEQLANALARQEELDRLKSDFIQNVSHELRTPLSIVHGYVSLLTVGEFGPLQPDQEEALSVVTRRVQMLTKLVDNFTAILMAEANVGPREQVDLVELVRMVLEDFQVSARQAGITLAGELALTPPVLGDGEQLRRVLDNLIGNALKFTPAGGQITVHVRPEEEWVLLEVSDTGIGIPAEQLDRIFERFYQVDSSMTRRYGGTGLGLALVKEIVAAHNGRLQVKSAAGQGSVFRIWLQPAEGWRYSSPEPSAG
ncbi:MAG: GAF domain-containing protein [Chloroflexi bacterium]|nr:GAF domain-containing protein [Chloroflexota bacterium]MCI0576562.1 GAF domain-containing protein [Chloroflexota bacterium]MCI0643807.1 GAF domain-containing protein [Chloroflexota bacterium]MCI0726095.1 GAF domain-containing protein [Chloroflexota bacterium]